MTIIEGLYQALQEAEIRFPQNPEVQVSIDGSPYMQDELAFELSTHQKYLEPVQVFDVLQELHEQPQSVHKDVYLAFRRLACFLLRFLHLDRIALEIPKNKPNAPVQPPAQEEPER